MIYPKILMVELTNKCNARCVYCGRQYDSRPSQNMDFSLFKKIVDSCPSATELHPQGIGEPLLYPKIVDAVTYAKNKNLKIIIYTNASPLNERLSIELIKAGLDDIVFSVDGCNKETFESLRRGLSWEQVVKNIEQFQRLKKGYPTKTFIRICRTLENKDSIRQTLLFWKPRVDNTHVKDEYDVPLPLTIEKQKWIDMEFPIRCKRPFEHLTVKSNGDVVLCCRDWYGQYIMGNIGDSDVLDVFNCEAFNQARKGIKSGFNCPHICLFCRNRPLRRHKID